MSVTIFTRNRNRSKRFHSKYLKLKTFFAYMSLIVGLCGYISLIYTPPTIAANNIHPYDDAKPNSAEAESKDNPQRTDDKYQTTIPRIIHQRWDTEFIPTLFVPWIRSWMDAHPAPRWKYYFWTRKGERALIQRYYPDFMETYNLFKSDLSKADSARPLMLHTYGGIYADVDLEVLKPLDTFIETNPCFLAANQPLHHVEETGYTIINGISGCTPKHPYLDLVRRDMTRHVTGSEDQTAGWQAWARALEVYRKQGNNSGDVTMAPPHVFTPLLDLDEIIIHLVSHCRIGAMDAIRMRDCQRLDDRIWDNFPIETDTLTNHHWIHFFKKQRDKYEGKYIHISSVVPHVLIDPAAVFT